MVPLIPCRSISTCASLLNYIHSCPSDLQRRCAWISAVMFHSSRRHDVKTTVAVLSPPIVWQYRQFICLLSAGEPSQFPAPAHNDLPSHVTSSIVLHRHSRFSDSISKHSYFPVHTRTSSLDFHFLTASVDLAVIAVMRYLNINFYKK